MSRRLAVLRYRNPIYCDRSPETSRVLSFFTV